jgi:23S rRNA A1618 N6-methylase RlmF
MSRKIKNRQGKKTFALIGDGETEYWYIQKLKEHEKEKLKNSNLKLEPELNHKKKLEELFEHIENLEEEYDKIFWIVDFDTIIKETKEAKKGKERTLDIFKRRRNKLLSNNKKIIIIINNPCFEFWLLQHFYSATKYFECYNGKLEREIKKHILNYDKSEKFYNNCGGGKGIYLLLERKLEEAISNSKKLPKLNFDKTDINDYEIGTTEMHKLFDELGISK